MAPLPRLVTILALLILLPGCDSIFAFVVGVEEIEGCDLRDRLRSSGDVQVLDVRPTDEYRAGHISGAISVTVAGIDGYISRAGPTTDAAIVVVCRGGYDSVDAAARIRARGYDDVASLRGGMDEWRMLGLPTRTGKGDRIPDDLGRPPLGRTTLVQQLATVVTAFGIKPLYMLMSLVLIVLLRRRRTRDLRLLRWGLIAFLFGEAACAANYIATMGFSDTLEILHQLGMVGMGTLLPWAFFETVDRRVLRFSAPDSSCAMTRFCRVCWKREATTCGLHRMFLWISPMLAVVALMPLTAPLRPLNILLPIFDTDVPFWSSAPELIAELRVYPILGAICFLAAHVLMRRGADGLRRAHLPFFLGIGFASFGVLRFVLVESFREMPVWADAWEEITELLIIVAAAIGLWIFRKPLGLLDEPDVADAGG
jgi:rhodanese-related sulfurtransferase